MQAVSRQSPLPAVLYPPDSPVRVLVVTPLERDHAYLKHTFHSANWQIEQAVSREDARALLECGGYAVLLCEQDLADGTWRDVLEDAARVPNPPVFVVTSRIADDPLWAEVLNLGGYDVLMKPFDRREVVRVLSQAWRQWKQESRIGPGAATYAAAR